MKRRVAGPVVVVVLDGWGWREDTTHNGIALAKTPVFDGLVKKYPFTLLGASGEAVGLPEGQIGNSEVGHTAIGAGRVIYQDLVRISKDLANQGATKNPAFAQAFAHATNRNSTLHIMGILSGGGVHGHEDHLLEVAKGAREAGVGRVRLHLFLDGRDTSRTAGMESLKKAEDFCHNHGVEIGSVMGRYFAMDRDNNWDRTDKAYDAVALGKAEHQYAAEVLPSEIVRGRYRSEIFDEFLEPMVFGSEEMKKGDAIIFTNFRKDRARQLVSRIIEKRSDSDMCLVTMTDYGQGIEAVVAYTPEERGTTLAEAVSKAGMRQAHIAETEKFAHVTLFLNGGREETWEGEEDILIPSRKDIKTHDLAPEMKAKEICDAAIEQLDKCEFIFINFANPDMVGHTAVQSAIVIAIETVDRELGRLVEATLNKKGALVVIADHGNAEIMVDPTTGEPHTAHTTSPVPCILVGETGVKELRHDEPGLADVAPTVLELLGLDKPESMTGTSCIQSDLV